MGALGAVVLADTRRLADCFPSVDYFEQRGTPFVVAVNCFDGAAAVQPRRGAQRARPRPGRAGGAVRRPRPARPANVLIELVEHVIASGSTRAVAVGAWMAPRVR